MLLNGASMAHVSIEEGLGQMPFDLLAELEQDMARLDMLLVGHCQRNVLPPGLWLEVATDMGEDLPCHEDNVAALTLQMEAALAIEGVEEVGWAD